MSTTYDFIDACAKSFKFFWSKRLLIAKLVLIPVLVKFITIVATFSFGLEGNILRQGLMRIPSFFIDGVLICYIVRIALIEAQIIQEQNKTLPFDDLKKGAIVFTLIQMFAYLTIGIVSTYTDLSQLENPDVQDQPPPNFLTFISILGFIGMMVWSFRLAWLHIPIMLGISVKEYLIAIKGMLSSVLMIATWVICMIPFLFITFIIGDLLSSLNTTEGMPMSTIPSFLFYGVQSFADIFIGIVSNLAIAFGVMKMIEKQQKTKGTS